MRDRGRRFLFTTLVATIGMFTLLTPGEAFSAEIAGLHFDEKIVLENRELGLRSLAVKEATFFAVDVYAVGLYLESDSLTIQTVLDSDQVKVITIKFTREVKGKKLADSWIRDLRAACESNCDSLLAAARTLTTRLPNVKKGQTFTYTVFPRRVDVFLDGTALGTLHGAAASQSVVAAIFGRRAAKRLKEDLLRPLVRAPN